MPLYTVINSRHLWTYFSFCALHYMFRSALVLARYFALFSQEFVLLNPGRTFSDLLQLLCTVRFSSFTYTLFYSVQASLWLHPRRDLCQESPKACITVNPQSSRAV